MNIRPLSAKKSSWRTCTSKQKKRVMSNIGSNNPNMKTNIVSLIEKDLEDSTNGL